MKLSEIVEWLSECDISSYVIGDETQQIVQVAGLTDAQDGEISFFSDKRRCNELKSTKASAVLITKEMADQTNANKIVVDVPYVAYAYIAQKLNPSKIHPGIHPESFVASSAIIPSSCQVDPGAYIAEGVQMGENCVVNYGSVIEEGTVLGDNCRIYPNVTIMDNCVLGNSVTVESGTVIGGQGFGFANQKGKWIRIPQLGRVIIGSNCWIGNNCTIDRGALEDTVIGDNCILDSLIHIAHNVEMGAGCAAAAQVGIAGSTKIGNYCVFAGQVGVNGHIEIADKAMFNAKSGVTHSIKAPGSYSGFPAVETGSWQKTTVRLKNLEKMSKQIKQLEKELESIKKQLED
ncbi:UDP-3-O-(3-hydroxymyristoyl)glucosamine N-acyltransferase [Hydrogenovibrio sp. JE_KL2]|uniref:UDP-3-O-(3-hydroxymyristoyl)glucosamine N-acyltransferase n=1 Tax=Hydrogenovibrio sp. JE_KL2 TaxID=2651188 RepID=UPI00128D6A81|nr:UDP-3-O-(3-hydroxymyristoyl)glucosamine N-acyltransferase [Hydrogenovibrio sp. JE_KL2]MPQ76064.1 UDP-3-O-(3-hydroxymyristoyl)glucosamine N-acyltransferase [Hydrogenovibrio sp. JE_KL2]